MNDTLLLGSRLVLGGYLAVHGAQKLFGSFGGHGLDATGKGFEHMGLAPGKPMAALAGVSEMAGGALTAAGALDPLGPVTVAGTMAVAALVHSPQGPMSQNGGYELPLANLALAGALAAVGPGRYAVGGRLPAVAVRGALAGAAALTAASVYKIVTKRRAVAAKAPATDATTRADGAAAAS